MPYVNPEGERSEPGGECPISGRLSEAIAKAVTEGGREGPPARLLP